MLLTSGLYEIEAKEKLTEVVYKHLFDGITQTKYRPTNFLNIDDISEILNISKTHIREALLEFEEEGLIIRKSRYCYIFSPLRKEIMQNHEIGRILKEKVTVLSVMNPYSELINAVSQIIKKNRRTIKNVRTEPDHFCRSKR